MSGTAFLRGLAAALLAASAVLSLEAGAQAADAASSPASASASASAPAPAPAPSASATASASPPPAGHRRPVEIDAPSALRSLLSTHLDLARAARLDGEAAPDDAEWARLVAAAPAQVRELAGTEGFFAPVVDISFADDDARTIRVKVDPGPPARVARVSLQFDGDLDRDAAGGDPEARAIESALARDWPLPEGSPFRNAAWADAKAQWLSRLRARGYGAATWSGTSATIDADSHQVRLFLVADSGPRFRAGELRIEGLERQKDELVRRLAGFGAGAPLEESRLLDYQDRLQKTGLFDQVAISYDPDPAQAAHATVTVHVHEQRLQQSTVAAGVSANTGPRVSLEYTNRRPFDQPVSLSSKLVWGRDEHSWNLDVTTHPGADFESRLVGVSIDRLVTSSDVTKTGYLRVGRTRDTTRFERLQFAELERSVQCTDNGCVDARALSLDQHTVWRRVDSVVLPTDGWTLSTQVAAGIAGGPQAVTGTPLASRAGMASAQAVSEVPADLRSVYGPFARLYGRYTQFWPLPGNWYATGRLELGQVIVDGRVNVPESELFRAGGDDSVRGYTYLSLAPIRSDGRVVGGNSLLTTSIELSRPLSDDLPSVWWAVFMDAGNAAPRFTDLKLDFGPGVGLRWRSPVGPLRIDWARGVAQHRGRLSLSLGIAF